MIHKSTDTRRAAEKDRQKIAWLLTMLNVLSFFPAAFGFVLCISPTAGGFDLVSNSTLQIFVLMLVCGELVFIGYVQFSRGKTLWCGEELFWIYSIIFNICLAISYIATVLLMVFIILPIVSVVLSVWALHKMES